MEKKVAVVLPRDSRYSQTHPSSIDTVVASLVANSEMQNSLCVFHSYIEEPVILYRHNHISAKNRFKKLLYNMQLSKVDNIVLVSQFSQIYFNKSWPKHAMKSFCIPNFISTQNWYSDPHALREKTIVYNGRPTAGKGFPEFCQAAKVLLEQHSNWTVVINIHEWHKNKLIAQPNLMPLQKHQNFTLNIDQPISKIQAVTKKAEIVVIPSKWLEPFGLVALEAHTAAAAVISSGTGGLREVSGDFAIYLEEINKDEIVKATNKLINNIELRKALQIKGQQYVLNKFTPSKIAKQHDDFLIESI